MAGGTCVSLRRHTASVLGDLDVGSCSGVQSLPGGGLEEEEEPTFVLPDQEGPDVAVVASTQAEDRQTCSCVIPKFPLVFLGAHWLSVARLQSLKNQNKPNQDSHLLAVACYNVAPLVYTQET